MAFNDNDDETSSVAPIAGLVDPNLPKHVRDAAIRQSLTGHIGARHHDKRHAKELWFEILMEQYRNQYRNMGGAAQAYWYSTNMREYPEVDYTKRCEIEGIVVPAGFSAVSFWAMARMANNDKELSRGEYLPILTTDPKTGEDHILHLHQNQADKFVLHHDNENFVLERENEAA